MIVHYAGAWVVNQQRELLLVHYPERDLWLPPGGAIHPRESPHIAALRWLYTDAGIGSGSIRPIEVLERAPPSIRENQLPVFADGLSITHCFAFKLVHNDISYESTKMCEWHPMLTEHDKLPFNVEWTIGYLDSVLCREEDST
jgi:8-oxo-dGTP pyrophosphatase MutT (NUDIX family)